MIPGISDDTRAAKTLLSGSCVRDDKYKTPCSFASPLKRLNKVGGGEGGKLPTLQFYFYGPKTQNTGNFSSIWCCKSPVDTDTPASYHSSSLCPGNQHSYKDPAEPAKVEMRNSTTGDLLVTPQQCSDISVFHGHGGEDHAPGPTQQLSTADFGDLTHSMCKYSTPCSDVIGCVRVHPKRPKSEMLVVDSTLSMVWPTERLSGFADFQGPLNCDEQPLFSQKHLQPPPGKIQPPAKPESPFPEMQPPAEEPGPPFPETQLPAEEPGPPFPETQPPAEEPGPPFKETQPPAEEPGPPFKETQLPAEEPGPPFPETWPLAEESEPPFPETQPPAEDFPTEPLSPQPAEYAAMDVPQENSFQQPQPTILILKTWTRLQTTQTPAEKPLDPPEHYQEKWRSGYTMV